MIFNKLDTIKIKGKFKFYPFIVLSDDRKLYQLPHFKSKRTCYFKEIVYNENRKGYRINSQWVSKNRLLKLFIKCDEVIEIY